LRQIIDEAMQLLDDIAHDADVAFEETHGGATKVRDMTNPGRFGNGYSAEAKRISLERKKKIGVWCASSTSASCTRHHSCASCLPATG
jgi:hypothetical protein